MEPKDVEQVEQVKNKLLKLKTKEYELKDIEFVFDKLNNKCNHHEISESLHSISTRQIKLIRFIYNKGTKQDIQLLKSCQFKISSIKRYIQARQVANRHKDPLYKLNKIMEQGKKKGSLI